MTVKPWSSTIKKGSDFLGRQQMFIVTGLGYGDEGKGNTVHGLSALHRAHTVIRTGGAQAYHRVVTSRGQEHIHSQFGSGTLAGAATHISRNMVIDPYAILHEGMDLVDELGVNDVFDKLTIHEEALVITPFQAIANRLRELDRGTSRHGSVGIGIGETVRDAEALGKEAIRASDLGKPALIGKLESIRDRKIIELRDVLERIESLPDPQRKRARFEAANLTRPETLEWALGWFNKLASVAAVVNTDFVAEKILGRLGTVIVESSQGVLLDRWYGFHPYTTKVRTTPEEAFAITKECGYQGEIQSIGVLRAYHTRHGAGPFVAESEKLMRALPDASNAEHPWQGSFRVGAFDVVAAKYALEVCETTAPINSLVVTCIDRIQSLGAWPLCKEYENSPEVNDTWFFTRNKEGFVERIRISTMMPHEEQILRQTELGHRLLTCKPVIETLSVSANDIDIFLKVLRDEISLPVAALIAGPTEKDYLDCVNN